MTGKQKIIHGVDVSGCVNRNDFKLASYDCYLKGGCQCKENSNCYYKQLKRLEKLLPDINGKFYKAMDDLKAKEQECEELKEINSTLLEYRRHAVTCQDCYEDGLEDGKTSNKELRKLRKTLAEIKEIIEPMVKNGYFVVNEIMGDFEKILQKINEVEDDKSNN